MLFRCIIQRKGDKLVGTVLELGIVELGENIQQVQARLEEAITCYFHAAVECGERCDEKILLNPVPFYWLRKTWFEINWRWSSRLSRSGDMTTWEEENYQVRMATA